MQRDCFAGLQVDVHSVAIAEPLDGATEALDVVAGAGDVVPSAEIEPFEPGDEVSEFCLKCIGGMFECIGVLFAQCMKVQSC